ncbi:MAG: type II secretion system F family protein [Pseudomonas sp.]|jgi:tight adherence protein C|nr:type II secretion system F family protein [Pseudomonas sp.]MDD2223731.1 type II secretion system F family protein [Pseudomonas sp.]MDY0415709.1 type II secretion system F family protein [Pseudomonas sp.]
MNPLLISALLFLVAGGLLLSSVIRSKMAMRTVIGRLGGAMHANAFDVLSNRSVSSDSKYFDSEVTGYLNQLGWRSGQHRAIFLLIQIILPLVLVFAALFVQSLLSADTDNGNMFWLTLVFAGGIGYLIPKRVLVKLAKVRQERLAVEVSTMIPLLRMLFEVGMTVEQALRILAESGQKMLPELARELKLILLRVDAGLDLGYELRDAAFLMQVDELTDCFTILEQLIQQGGGGMHSLLSLKELLDDRRMTSLQEKVSKMSAKMSIVMMVFLFPALLIVLAGPGFIAIIQALGDMG